MSACRLPVAIALVFILAVSACNNSADNTTVTIADSLNKPSIKDTAPEARNVQEEEVEADPKTILSDYLERYDKKIIIDTSYESRKDKFHLHLEYYCLFDSSIHVPKPYVALYGLDSFVTHAFEAKLTLDKNGKEILRSRVRRENFDSIPDYAPLANYGALLYPTFDLNNGIAEIGFSISVPLTDVGTHVSVKLENDGRLYYRIR